MQREKLQELEYRSWGNVIRGFDAPNDILSKLLTIHLITETVLEQIIGVALEQNADAVLSVSLTYNQKLDMCAKLVFDDSNPALSSNIVGSLRKLNALRNKASHRLRNEIVEEDIVALFENIENELPEDVQEGDSVVKLNSYYAYILPMMYGRNVKET